MSDQHQAGGSGAVSTDLEAIRARANAAMPGPWRSYVGSNSDLWVVDQAPGPLSRGGIVCSNNGPPSNEYSQANSEFIAHAREDIPALVADLEAARTERDYLAHEHQSHHPVCSATPAICSHEADLAQARARISDLEQGLRRILEWDCLSPEPRSDLLHDLPWLKAHVLALLDAATATKGADA